MKYLFKPIALSLRYKWTLLGSILNALVISVLWGASITAIYPFVEVIFEGGTIEGWLNNAVDGARDKVTELDAEIAQLEDNLREADDAEKIAQLRGSLSLTTGRREVEERSLAFYSSLKRRLSGTLPSTAFGTLALLMGLLVAATVLKGICLVLNVILVARVADRTAMDMRRIFYRSALEMDQNKIDNLGTTQLMTMLSHNVNLVSAGLKRLYGQSVREPLKMAVCLIAAAYISWRLLLLSLLIAPLGAALIHYLARRMKRVALHEMGGVAAVFQTLIETFNGLKVVRIFNREQRERGRFKRNARTLYQLSMKMAFYDSLVRPITELIGVLSLVVAVLVGAYLVLNQETHLFGIQLCVVPLSASALFMFFGLLAGISDPVRKMGDIYNVLVRAETASCRLFTIFEEQPAVVAQSPRAPVPTHSKSISFKNVIFGYRPLKMVLLRVNLEVPFGQTVALVGPNGCGKTTLVNLLARFYDPVRGKIFLDGANMRNLDPGKLRRQIAMVGQDPILFRGTIWDNIVYGARRATREQVLEAATVARVDEFASKLPHGYQTPVGDQGKFLSGGQRQRIALARALISNPRILILDEATSQIDRQAEGLLHEGLKDLLKNFTTFMITHRLSSLALADRVVVMDGGRIVMDKPASEYRPEDGPFTTVLAKAA